MSVNAFVYTVYVYVCMHTCVSQCVHMIYLCVCPHVSVYIYGCIHVRAYVHVYTNMCVGIYV